MLATLPMAHFNLFINPQIYIVGENPISVSIAIHATDQSRPYLFYGTQATMTAGQLFLCQQLPSEINGCAIAMKNRLIPTIH